MREGGRTVGHHGVCGRVELVIVSVEEHSMLPEVMSLAGMDKLGNVQLARVHLDEVHELLRLVLGVQDAQLRVHSNMRPLACEACVQEADEFLEVSLLLVVCNKLLQVVRVHYDVHARDLRATELLGLHAGNVHLLPRLRVVGLSSGLNGVGILPKLHVTRGELGVVGNGLVEDLGGLVRALLVEAVADRLNVCSVGPAHKLLHVSQAIGLRVREYQLAIDESILLLVPCHEEVPD
mmetsp:Transcript_39737/g.89625  ORF Transcript_39737/g.89625 Transcript_39737/m.89625 type:complete len:236 (-) Transcript_39737:2442-3149(-)